MAEFERIEKVSYLRIFTHNINKRKFMISVLCEWLQTREDRWPSHKSEIDRTTRRMTPRN